MNQLSEAHPSASDLHARRQELHGKRRQLHERLSEVCEDFVMQEHLTRDHRQRGLLRELQYLTDYYQDEESWKGIS
jgi:hypothetical protein